VSQVRLPARVLRSDAARGGGARLMLPHCCLRCRFHTVCMQAPLPLAPGPPRQRAPTPRKNFFRP
jgi:hypothetical protein